MKTFWTALILLALLVSYPAQAQDRLLTGDRFSVEIGSEADFATQDLGAADLGTGLGLEATVGYRFMPHLSAYAGWGWRRFPADGFLSGMDMDAEETGYTFGLQFAHPLGATPFGYFVQAGGVYDHIEVEDNDSDLVMDTGHGLGWQLGAGIVLPLCAALADGDRPPVPVALSGPRDRRDHDGPQPALRHRPGRHRPDVLA